MNFRYSPWFKGIRLIAKSVLSSAYPLIIRIWRLPVVASIDDTLDKIIIDKCSIARFGDGEFLYIIDRLNLPFQKQEPQLRHKLISILKNDEKKILIGLPIGYHSLDNLNRETLKTWRSQISWIYPRLHSYLNHSSLYYNASMTRPYADYDNKDHVSRYFEKLKSIWLEREVLLIEGEKSRLGVGNDLFTNTRSVQRVLCPMHHAFSVYDKIFSFVLNQPKSKLILIALGPTATALAYDLAKLGYQSVDIGNVDIEYEWYKTRAKSKVKIKGKYTSEAPGGRNVEDIDDEIYKSQIVTIIE